MLASDPMIVKPASKVLGFSDVDDLTFFDQEIHTRGNIGVRGPVEPPHQWEESYQIVFMQADVPRGVCKSGIFRIFGSNRSQ